MQFIKGNNQHQTYFTTPDDQVSADNAVRLMDAFIDKPDLQKLGFPPIGPSTSANWLTLALAQGCSVGNVCRIPCAIC